MFVWSELLRIITNYTIMKSNYRRRSHYTVIHFHKIKPKGQNVDYIQLNHCSLVMTNPKYVCFKSMNE